MLSQRNNDQQWGAQSPFCHRNAEDSVRPVCFRSEVTCRPRESCVCEAPWHRCWALGVAKPAAGAPSPLPGREARTRLNASPAIGNVAHGHAALKVLSTLWTGHRTGSHKRRKLPPRGPTVGTRTHRLPWGAVMNTRHFFVLLLSSGGPRLGTWERALEMPGPRT